MTRAVTMQITPSPDTAEPDYITGDGTRLWLARKGQRTRFVTADLTQYGPTHANFVPAVVYAAAQGWRDPSAPDWLNDGVIAEVAYGDAAPQPGQRGYDPRGLNDREVRR